MPQSSNAACASSSDRRVFDRAGRWFLESGIREPGGGVARYHRSDFARNAPVSNEITGYAASALTYLYTETGASEYLDAALETARFLAREAWDKTLAILPFEHPGSAQAYFFDCGIVVRGLLAVWRCAPDREFLDAAERIADSMRRDFFAAPAYHPILNLPSKDPLPREPGRWSRNPGCYQLKSALAWNDLWEETNISGYLELYEGALAQAIETEESFLPGVDNEEQVMDRLHAYCYFLEGLRPRSDRYASILENGIARVAGYLRRISPRFTRSDVWAQLLRLRLYAHYLNAVALDPALAAQEAAALAAFQLDDPDPRLQGGFCFGRKSGVLLPFVNPVSTAFALQALRMWDQHRQGTLRINRQALI